MFKTALLLFFTALLAVSVSSALQQSDGLLLSATITAFLFSAAVMLLILTMSAGKQWYDRYEEPPSMWLKDLTYLPVSRRETLDNASKSLDEERRAFRDWWAKNK